VATKPNPPASRAPAGRQRRLNLAPPAEPERQATAAAVIDPQIIAELAKRIMSKPPFSTVSRRSTISRGRRPRLPEGGWWRPKAQESKTLSSRILPVRGGCGGLKRQPAGRGGAIIPTMSARAEELQNARVFSATHVLMPEISYQAFTYPGDEEAVTALKKVPGAPQLLTYLGENFTEQLIYVENNEQMIRAGTGSFGSLYKLLVRCAEILSCPVPDLYVTNNPIMNAYTVGHRRTCLVLHSALVEAMTADELCFVIGHELGHIKCGHGLYRQLGDLLIESWDAVSSLIPVPGIGMIRIPLLIAYWEWFRRAEMTGDRAGLLCVQDAQTALTGLGKLAGRVSGLENEFNIESAISQAGALQEVNKLVLVVSIMNNAQNTHPFVPNRLKQIREYAASPEYQQVLRGEYKRDVHGLHEGGLRVKCECGAKVNAKLSVCPECGRPIDATQGEAAALAAQEAPPTGASGLSKFKSMGAGFLKRP
jgi:Zn-dependent protease with chaperone function